MVEVEQAPSYLFKKNDPTKVATEESSNQLKSDLEEAISRISELEGSNEELKEARTKAENFLFEFKKHSDALGPESAETVERIAKQKADAEVLLAGLEGLQFELEEKGTASDSGIVELQKYLDAAQLDWSVTRLDLEAQSKPRSPSHWSSQFRGLVRPRTYASIAVLNPRFPVEESGVFEVRAATR